MGQNDILCNDRKKTTSSKCQQSLIKIYENQPVLYHNNKSKSIENKVALHQVSPIRWPTEELRCYSRTAASKSTFPTTEAYRSHRPKAQSNELNLSLNTIKHCLVMFMDAASYGAVQTWTFDENQTCAEHCSGSSSIFKYRPTGLVDSPILLDWTVLDGVQWLYSLFDWSLRGFWVWPKRNAIMFEPNENLGKKN